MLNSFKLSSSTYFPMANSKKQYSHICFVGDFNFRDINWDSWSTNHNENSKEHKFIETIRDCFLHQHNHINSRHRGNEQPSLLDLILSNETMQVSDVAHHPPLGKSDHNVITFNFNCYVDYSKPKEVFRYDKADFEAMRQNIRDTSWKTKYITSVKNKNVEKLWEDLKSKIHEMRDKFVPKIKQHDQPTWKEKGGYPINTALKDAIHKKRVMHRRWMVSTHFPNSESARLGYTRARNKVTNLMRQAKRKHEKDIANNCKNNPRVFWSHVRLQLKTKSGVAPLLAKEDDKESLKFSDHDKANILQHQFSSVYTKEPNGLIPTLPKRSRVNMLDLHVTVDMVRDEILALNPNKACGPDEIHPRMLQELVNELSDPITIIMNETVKHGKLPTDWKRAIVTPIFKKGAKNKAENYRPISLTSLVCKLMESLFKYLIMDHLKKQKLLSPLQHGFITGRSTTTQLIHYLDKCLEHTVNGEVVDAIYLDFTKAFDSVPHRRLLGKLESYGITSSTLKWIEAFLDKRSQVVRVNSVESVSAQVLSGIPQGSVLGPVLFTIYINDLLEGINSNGFMFADDAKIFHQVLCKEDADNLQKDLNTLENWSSKWLLNFNCDKCHVLTVGKLENIKHTQRYTLYEKELEHVFEEKDLGVVIDTELNFEDHISSKVKKANMIMGLIRRSFSFLDRHLFKKLYTTFVRPHLEYAQAVWQPFLRKHVNIIENVQKRATKLVDGLSELPYDERLRCIDLPTLEYRRARGDMIEIYKHFHAYDRQSLAVSFKPRDRPSRSHNYQLYIPVPKDGVRGPQSNSFYFRTPKIWNELSTHVVEANNINTFKARLDEHWKDNPKKYN